MMNNSINDIAVKQFKRDLIIKTVVQEKQFEQWLKFTFYLNEKLREEYDSIYQDAFYIHVYEILTEGLTYANKVYEGLLKSKNLKKIKWYSELINGLNKVKSDLSDSELLYIEYRRHIASHIFQNSYEFIQDNFKIKKERNKENLKDIKEKLNTLIINHGGDRELDDFLNHKIQSYLKKIYENLQSIHFESS